MTRYLHQAKVLTQPPQDYVERFRASHPGINTRMTFNTDEATNDISAWTGELGVIEMIRGGTTYPSLQTDSNGHKYIDFDGTCWLYDGLIPSYQSSTVIGAIYCDSVQSVANSYSVRGPCDIRLGTAIGLGTEPYPYHVNTYPSIPTNSVKDRVSIQCVTAQYNGAGDNDIRVYIGKTLIDSADSSADVGYNRLYFANWANSVTWQTKCRIYEVVIFDRALSAAEVEDWAEYLSNAYSCADSDSASDDPFLANAGDAQWVNAGLDRDGEGIDTIPGRQAGEYSVLPLPDRNAPRIGDIPPQADYKVNMDASEINVLSWSTDEATGDLATFRDSTGNFWQLRTGAATRPPTLTTDSDGLPCLLYQNDNGHYFDYSEAWPDNGFTFFSAMQFDDNVIAGDQVGTFVGGDMRTEVRQTPSATVWVGEGTDVSESTNDFVNTGRRFISSATCAAAGAGGSSADHFYYIGKTQIGSQTPASFGTTESFRCVLGCWRNGFFGAYCKIYQFLVYDRVLNQTEREAVVDYLSNKWKATNADNASDTFSPPPPYILDDNYPITEFGSLVKWWFRADRTDGMTFATGDAQSGGTVSSWTDITGQQTATSAAVTNGGQPIDYVPHAKGPFPAVKGDAVNKALTTGVISYSQVSGDQRLMWCVLRADSKTADNVMLTMRGQFAYAYLEGSWTGDLYPGQPHVTPYAGEYRGSSVEDPRDRHVIFVWRETIQSDLTADCEAWYSGIQQPTTLGQASTGGRLTFCAYNGNIDTFVSDAYIYEAGFVDAGQTGVTDTQVYNLIRHLSERYNEPFMPRSTPIDVGFQERTRTSTVAQHDLVYWFAPQYAADGAWPNHPLITEHIDFPVITPEATYNDTAMTLSSKIGRTTNGCDITAKQGGSEATLYNFAETTSFPATDEGLSLGVVARCSASATDEMMLSVSPLDVRKTAAGNIAAAEVAVGTSEIANDRTNDWVVAVGTFDDVGNEIAVYSNDDTPVTTSQACTTIGNARPTIGRRGGFDTYRHDGDVSEVWVYKHVLSQREFDNLKRYARFWFQDPFD